MYHMNVCSVLFSSLQPQWTVAVQATLSIEISRQEYWSVLPFLTPEDLPKPGTEPMSPAFAGRFFTTVPPGKPKLTILQKLTSKLTILKKNNNKMLSEKFYPSC